MWGLLHPYEPGSWEYLEKRKKIHIETLKDLEAYSNNNKSTDNNIIICYKLIRFTKQVQREFQTSIHFNRNKRKTHIFLPLKPYYSPLSKVTKGKVRRVEWGIHKADHRRINDEDDFNVSWRRKFIQLFNLYDSNVLRDPSVGTSLVLNQFKSGQTTSWQFSEWVLGCRDEITGS